MNAKASDPGAYFSATVDPHVLRHQAEVYLRASQAATARPPDVLSAEQNRALIHELQVHQIELELQNDELHRSQAELAALRGHDFELFDLAPVGYLTLDAQGRLLQANLTAANLLGVDRQSLSSRPISHYIFKSDQDIFYLHHKQLQAGGEVQDFDLRLSPERGNTLWAHLTLSATSGTAITPMLRLMIKDISERKLAEQALQESEQRFRHLFEANSSVMLLIEPLSGQIMDANRSAVRFYGYPRATLVGMCINQINVETAKPAREPPRGIPAEKRRRFDITQRLANADLRYVEVFSTPIQSGGRALLFSIIHDTTERHLLESKVRQLAFYDALTRLPNRRLINDRLAQTLAKTKRSGHFAALMMLDLDNFKALNDEHGHQVGDLLLIEVARRLGASVREVDTVGRFGGDEFVVLISELSVGIGQSTAQTNLIAEKIRLSLSEPYQLTVHHDQQPDTLVEHCCSASIGVKVFGDNACTSVDILKWADAAMYQAKNQGGNRVQFFVPA